MMPAMRATALAWLLLVASCAVTPPVQDRTWYWLDARPPEAYTLQIHDDRAAIRADCNRGTGTVTAQGERISFGPMAMTRAFCRPPSRGDEYARQLQSAERLSVYGDVLRMELKGGGAMYFATDTKARLAQFRCRDEQVMSVVYLGDTAQVWFREEHFVLNRAPAASGALYADGTLGMLQQARAASGGLYAEGTVEFRTQGIFATLRKGDAVLAHNCQLPSH